MRVKKNKNNTILINVEMWTMNTLGCTNINKLDLQSQCHRHCKVLAKNATKNNACCSEKLLFV